MRIDPKYEGKCIALVKGKIVASGKDVRKVVAQARERFPGEEIVLTNVLKGDALFVL